MILPRTCSHGVSFGIGSRCIDCEIIWTTESLDHAQQDVIKYGARLAKLRCEQVAIPETEKQESAA